MVKEFYFVPEKQLPDTFYTSMDMYATLDCIPLHDHYRCAMDMDSNWVEHVYRIVQDTPHPRQASRPQRPLRTRSQVDATVRPTVPERLPRELSCFAEKYFRNVMIQCALRRSGLLFVLAREHPTADFGYCRYQWSEREKEVFLLSNQPPRTISHLPMSTPVVPTLVYAKHRAGSSRGPILTPSEFKRLDACNAGRLLFFDMFGLEGHDVCSPVVAIPSEDISISSVDRDRYWTNLAKHKRNEYMARSPLLAQQIHRPNAVTDYILCATGPLIFERSSGHTQWADIWELLHACSDVNGFSHPPGSQRLPEQFRVTVRQLHQSLADYHATIEVRQAFAELNVPDREDAEGGMLDI